MKKVFKYILFFILLVPIFLYAETKRTYTNNITVANNYISKFSDRNKYFIFPMKYSYVYPGTITENTDYVNGGILSEHEYNTTRYSERIGYNTYYYSYLGIGKEYWVDYLYTVDNDISSGQKSSSYKAGTRVTEYVKPGIEIKGKGTYGSPWEFEDGYYIDIIPNSESYGTVTPRTKMAKPGETVTINIVPAPGFSYSGNDDCRLNRVGTTDRYTINNISRDVSCVVVFDSPTYEFNLITNITGATQAYPNKLYYKPGKGFYSNSTLTNKVTQLITLPTAPGYQFDGFTYNGETIITEDGVVSQNISNLNSNQSTQTLTSAFKNSQLMAGNSADDTEPFLRTAIAKKDIEKITFTTSLGTHTANGTDCFDVSKDNNGTVLAWATDTDNNGLYELTIGAKTKIYLYSGSYLFGYLTNLKSFVGMQYVDSSLVTQMHYMFSGCNNLVSLDLSSFDTSNVTGMVGMFLNCTKLTSVNLSSFDTSNVTNLSYMFYQCNSLTSLNINNFNTSKVTNMSYMFYGCKYLTTLDLRNFDTSKVTNMFGLFSGCSGLTSVNLSSFNTLNVTDMGGMFSGCKSLTSLNVSNFNTSKVTNMSSMFSDCSSLTSLNVSNFDTSKVTNMNTMFTWCQGLTSLNLSNFNTSNVTSMFQMFGWATNLTSLNISSFNTSNVTDMGGMFAGCNSLTSLNVSNFNTSKVTNMSSMFSDCSSLTSLNVSNFDTSKVENFAGMFAHCSNLGSLDLRNFNTSSATRIGGQKLSENSYSGSGMFEGCKNLTSLDLSSFNTSKVDYMAILFYGCQNLKTIYVGNNFVLKSGVDTSDMFKSSYALVGGAGTVYNVANIDGSYAHIDGGTSNPGYFTRK